MCLLELQSVSQEPTQVHVSPGAPLGCDSFADVASGTLLVSRDWMGVGSRREIMEVKDRGHHLSPCIHASA